MQALRAVSSSRSWVLDKWIRKRGLFSLNSLKLIANSQCDMTWHPSNADGTDSKWGTEHKVLNHKVSDIQYLLQGGGGGKILTSKHHWSVSKQTEQLIIIIITIIAAALASSSSRGKKNVLGLFLIVTWDLKYFIFSSSECKPSTHTHTHTHTRLQMRNTPRLSRLAWRESN